MELLQIVEKHYKVDKDVHVEMRCKHAPARPVSFLGTGRPGAYSQLNVLLLNGPLRPTLMYEEPLYAVKKL